MENINKPHTSIKNWAADDRPREKLIQHGSQHLSATELLAILINHGTRSKSAIDLSRELFALAENKLKNLSKFTLKDFQKVKGIGPAKSVTIKAALQLAIAAEQEMVSEKTIIGQSSEIASFFQKRMQHENRELFMVAYLNKRNQILCSEVLSIGGISNTVVDIRLILRKAIEEQASAMIVAHNHPSGNLTPSKADIEITQKLKAAARVMDITMLDHIIVSDEGYYSFADSGDLNR